MVEARGFSEPRTGRLSLAVRIEQCSNEGNVAQNQNANDPQTACNVIACLKNANSRLIVADRSLLHQNPLPRMQHTSYFQRIHLTIGLFQSQGN